MLRVTLFADCNSISEYCSLLWRKRPERNRLFHIVLDEIPSLRSHLFGAEKVEDGTLVAAIIEFMKKHFPESFYLHEYPSYKILERILLARRAREGARGNTSSQAIEEARFFLQLSQAAFEQDQLASATCAYAFISLDCPCAPLQLDPSEQVKYRSDKTSSEAHQRSTPLHKSFVIEQAALKRDVFADGLESTSKACSPSHWIDIFLKDQISKATFISVTREHWLHRTLRRRGLSIENADDHLFAAEKRAFKAILDAELGRDYDTTTARASASGNVRC